MKYILTTLCLIFFGCRAEKNLPHTKSTVDSAENKLHGVWESYMIRSKEKYPPKKITLKFTAYNDTKLIWMKMIAEGKAGEKFDKTIRVSVSEKRGYIIPSVRKELEESEDDDRFIRYDPKRIKEVKGLEWKYNLTEDRLTIEMEGSLIVLRRKQ
ncbi:MAG: hypothetical protein NE327_05525 [Lentisphaeraceae bacterium]|nr:hypothetical protein [Lentisphaeraceae bacterium]